MAKKQSSGLYRTKVKIGVDHEGKDIVKWVSGKTKKELEEERQRVIAYYIDGTGLEDDRLFGEYLQEWFVTIKKPELSDASIMNWRSMINKHVLPTFGKRNMRAIKAMELQTWLNTFAGESKSTIAQAAAVMRNIFSAAYADRLIASNPAAALRLPKAGSKEARRSLTAEESAKVERIIREHEHGAYIACLYYLGLRSGEARGLMWGDFDWENSIVTIQRDIDYKAKGEVGALKSGAAYREVPVPNELREVLWPMRGHPNAFLFVGARSRAPWSKATAERIWLDMMISVGLVEDREGGTWKNPDVRSRYKAVITPHYLRHNYITRCWEAEIDPMITMRIVGHSDYRTTANIYTHLQEEHLRKTKSRLDAIFAGKKVAQKLHKTSGDDY